MSTLTMNDASAICDAIVREALDRYCRDLLAGMGTDRRQTHPASPEPRRRGRGADGSRSAKAGSLSRDEVLKRLRDAGYQITHRPGPHPYKATNPAHPGAVFPFAANRHYSRPQLENYRRGFRQTFGVEPPF